MQCSCLGLCSKLLMYRRSQPETCPSSENWSWRYFVLNLGALAFLMFICVSFSFTYTSHLNPFSLSATKPKLSSLSMASPIITKARHGSQRTCYTVDIKHVGPKRYHGYCYLHKRYLHLLLHHLRRYKFQLAFTCLEALFQNIMYGVLYTYTPNVFPTPNRGTGIRIASSLNRVAVQCAPIVAINAGSGNPKAQIYASGALFIAAFGTMLPLPIEIMGRQDM